MIQKYTQYQRRDSNPYEINSADFLTTPYHYGRKSVVVWTMPLPYPLLDLGSGCLVSTHLGLLHLARRCLRESFAELAHIHLAVSKSKCSNCQSPLRKPIPPRWYWVYSNKKAAYRLLPEPHQSRKVPTSSYFYSPISYDSK